MAHVNCSVYGCYATPKKYKDLKFHRIPRDERCQYWIDACRRPDLKDRNMKQLYSLLVCGLHFPEWMYMKKKLKSAAIPILNLPSASINSISTQTEESVSTALSIEEIKYSSNGGVQTQIDSSSSGVSVAAWTINVPTSQTAKNNTANSRKRKRKQILTTAKKLKSMENIKSTKAVITRRQFLQGCDKFLSPNLSKVVKPQTNFKPYRYSKEFKLFCLNLYYSNPRAYNLPSKTLLLPPKHTLATTAIPMSTKISDYVWEVLSRVIGRLSHFERECTLCMNKISVKCSLFYDTHRDKIVGLHEINDIQNPRAAIYAFTIMLKGISGNWKQLVGYAFIPTSNIDNSLEKWIIDTAKQLFELGFKIRAVVSNHESEFIKFSDLKGVTKPTPHFEIDGKKVYYIFDVLHLIKCVRDNFMTYNFEFNGRTASWDDICKCYQLDKQKDFRFAPKLKDFHISPNYLQKKEVRLATQALSNSVKVALENYTKSGELNSCVVTVEFIDTMNKLFDLLNSYNILSINPYKQPYRGNELQNKLLLKAQSLFNSLIVRDKDTDKEVTTSIKFINAFSITINSIMQLYDDLKKESGSNEFQLFTRNLNNESLELFFVTMRQAIGNGRKRSCSEFERVFRNCFLWQTFMVDNATDCYDSDDFDNTTSKYDYFVQNKSMFTKSSIIAGSITREPSINFNISEQDNFLYICGYVLRRCLDKHKCPALMNYLADYTVNPTTSNRASSTLHDSFGGLHVPPAHLIGYCIELEARFKQSFHLSVGNNISKLLLESLSKVEFKSRPCSCFPQLYLIKLFIRKRLHYLVKYHNRKQKGSENKVLHKYFEVKT